MRTPEEVELVDRLVAEGFNDCQIARATGIPRGTVRDWRHGKRPNFERCPSYPPGIDPQLPTSAQSAYAYLLGLYLGDGWISRHQRASRLRIALDGIYPGIVAECVSAMETVVPNRVLVQKTASRAVAVGAYSRSWPQLFPQHGPGPKHSRRIELAAWQRDITGAHPELLIRGLIHSDGWRGTNRVCVNGKRYHYPRYNFCNKSEDIKRIFCEHLDLLGIPWRRMNAMNISVARREAVARLDDFVGPKK